MPKSASSLVIFNQAVNRLLIREKQLCLHSSELRQRRIGETLCAHPAQNSGEKKKQASESFSVEIFHCEDANASTSRLSYSKEVSETGNCN